MRPSIRIIELATLDDVDRSAIASVLAEWHSVEFAHLYTPDVWNREAALREFLEMSQPGVVPTTWLAVEGDDAAEPTATSVVGSVSLIATDDLDGFDDVGPWLASLFIRPDARSRGIGHILCDHLLSAARTMGFGSVCLFTEGQELYYADRGWRTIGHPSANGHVVAVMKRSTSPTAARRATASHWISNPDVAGAYSYVRVGGSPLARRTFDGEVLARLWFAGEHTCVEYPATMHGAWFSGERAARQIIATAPAGASVLVVGAGLSGLVAGQMLHAAGLMVTIVDSADRLGGRAAIDRSLGLALPLGGAWLHGTEGHPLADLVRSRPDDWSDIRTVVESSDQIDADATADATDVAEAVQNAETEFSWFLDAMERADPSTTVAQSAERWKRSHPARGPVAGLVFDHLARTYFENLYAAPMHLASAAYVHEDYELPGGDAFITSDLGLVIDDMARGLDVRLGVGVRRLTREGDRWFSDIEIAADCVLVTAPIGALRTRRIAFEPALPEELLDAIDALDAGPVCKVFATYDTRWWDDERPVEGSRGSAAVRLVGNPDPLPFVIVTDISERTGVPTLMWFAIGDDAQRAEHLTEDQLCALVDAVAARCPISLRHES